MEKIWLKQYPKGVPFEINPDQYQSLVDIFAQSCEQFADRPAFYNLGTTLTYQQLDHYSRAFAAYLQQALKLRQGDKVAIMMPNILQYPIALFGILRAGLVVVNVNPLYTAPELVHQLTDSGTKTIIVLANFVGALQQALADINLSHIIVTDFGDLFPRPKAWIFYFYFKYLKKKIPKLSFSFIRFRDALSTQLEFQPVSVHHDDIAFLQYTGGTTGVAKGAVLSHRNMVANILQAGAWFSNELKPGEEIIITALPLYHIFSLTANCLLISKIGGLNVFITNPRDIPHMIKEMAKFKFTVLTGVSTLFHGLLNNAKFAQLDFTAMKLSLGGGMAVQSSVAKKWQAVTKKPLLEGYGLTETSPCVAINPPDLTAYNGTIGLPIPSTDVVIFNDQGQAVPYGEAGELAVAGPQVMQGYWQNPSETQKVFTPEGWLLTGDIAKMDDKGFLSILERKKDMILVSGFNVYPNEIEDVLLHMPGVREAAVIGIPDEMSGEAVKAFIVSQGAPLTKANVIQFCRKNLTGYKVPKEVEFCDELPKSYVGKILRRNLRDKA